MQGLLIPDWAAGVAGSAFVLLVAMVGYFVKRTIDKLDRIDAVEKAVRDLALEIAKGGASKAELASISHELVAGKATIHSRLDALVERVGEVEVRCAGMHGGPVTTKKGSRS